MARVIYLDNHKQVQAQDLESVEHCDYWIDVLQKRITSIESRMSLPNYKRDNRDVTAIFYRKQALQQVENRKKFLLRNAGGYRRRPLAA